MGLASALSTALTGLIGSESTIDVVGNNLANSSTVGFKESSVSFATQFSQTYSTGSSPTASNGGTNPIQVGLGTTLASITADFTEGTVSNNSTTTDMAIQGNGFFIIQQSDGSYAYTRDGEFTLDSNNQLITASGNQVLGYTVNSDFNLITTSLAPLTIPLGTKMVAQATKNVTLTGTLSPSGSIADTATVLDTDKLYNGTTGGTLISDSTLLTNVTKYDNTTSTYVNVFSSTGTLNVTEGKGSKDLSNAYTITATSTVGDLLTFINQTLGIQTGSGIPTSKNVADPSSPYTAGAQIISGKITVVGNNGVDNDVAISSLTLTPNGSTIAGAVDLPFSTVQDGVGQCAAVGFQVYDSLGIACNVTVTAVLQSTSSTTTTYRWFADSTANQTTGSAQVAVGTGLITFDSNGNVISVSPDTISINRDYVASTKPLVITLDFSGVSGLSVTTSTFNNPTQDGCGPGTLSSYTIGSDGLITGVFSNNAKRTLGQVVLANFINPNGLMQTGDNLYTAGANSGTPIYSTPGQSGIGTVTSGAVELSNTDVGSNLIKLILASTMYRANTKVITTVQTMLDTLLQLQPY